MREIRFRAWNGSKMFYDDLVVVGPDIGLNALLAKTAKLFHLMQFTGLKDKNGKEIYEGDVVQTYRGNFKVRWSDKKTGFYGMDVNIRRTIADLSVNGEIIGNIYENPELIKT